ncbi:MAG: muconolactone delta-isomerase, partial [Actinomycetota bacterium]|nr:muconolactone delta-isomerase [Actinomycetota bacterium]
MEDVRTREAAHSCELRDAETPAAPVAFALQPGQWHSLSPFAANDDTQLEEVLASMPLRVWRSDE